MLYGKKKIVFGVDCVELSWCSLILTGDLGWICLSDGWIHRYGDELRWVDEFWGGKISTSPFSSGLSAISCCVLDLRCQDDIVICFFVDRGYLVLLYVVKFCYWLCSRYSYFGSECSMFQDFRLRCYINHLNLLILVLPVELNHLYLCFLAIDGETCIDMRR